jgi:outer membrane protein assembly factor BamB
MLNKNNVTPIHVYILFWSVFLVIAGLYLHPVEVKKIEVYRFDDFQQGQFKGTALDSKGRLFIGPGIKEIPGPGKEYYLSLDMAPSGNIYIGTGHQASVYQIKPIASSPAAANISEDLPGNIEAIFESDSELDVYGVLVTGTGSSNETVFVGTSPDGKVYKISQNKGKKEFFDPDEKFIWDLKEDKTGKIICAVGNSGGVYQITPEGQGAQIFAAEDTHIISLYISWREAGTGESSTASITEKLKCSLILPSKKSGVSVKTTRATFISLPPRRYPWPVKLAAIVPGRNPYS